jgi:histidine phosphotransferase ChpT
MPMQSDGRRAAAPCFVDMSRGVHGTPRGCDEKTIPDGDSSLGSGVAKHVSRLNACASGPVGSRRLYLRLQAAGLVASCQAGGLFSMAERIQPTDLELAALISSKICHDLIGPVGNINNGLEILDDEDDPSSRDYALDVIRNVTETASARLQFARFAFGATDSAGAKIDLTTAEELSRGLIGNGKHKLAWRGLKGQIAKDKAKLLLNLVAIAPTAIPRGGEIVVEIGGTLSAPSFALHCHGTSARPPQYFTEFVNGPAPAITALTIQAYYTVRLAIASRMRLAIVKDGADVVLTAK